MSPTNTLGFFSYCLLTRNFSFSTFKVEPRRRRNFRPRSFDAVAFRHCFYFSRRLALVGSSSVGLGLDFAFGRMRIAANGIPRAIRLLSPGPPRRLVANGARTGAAATGLSQYPNGEEGELLYNTFATEPYIGNKRSNAFGICV